MSNYTVWVSYLLCRYAGTFLACRNYKNWVSNITTMQKMIPTDFLSFKGLDDVWVFIWFILLSFTVDDMYGERLYLVNMNLSFCFESSAACYKTIVVFSDTLLPKTSCSWNSQQGLIFYIYLSSIKIFKQIQNMVKCKLDLKQFFFIIYVGDMVLQVSPWVIGDPVMGSLQVVQCLGGQSYCYMRS